MFPLNYCFSHFYRLMATSVFQKENSFVISSPVAKQVQMHFVVKYFSGHLIPFIIDVSIFVAEKTLSIQSEQEMQTH